MLDLDRELQKYSEYLDEMVEPIDLPVIEPDRVLGRPFRMRRLAPAFGAALVLVVALGLMVVLGPFRVDEPPFVDEPTTVSIAPQTSTSMGSAPTPTEPAAPALPSMSWTRVDDGGVFGGAERLDSLVVTEAGLFALGSVSSEGAENAAVFFSADGLAWSPVDDESGEFGGAGSQFVKSLAQVGGQLIAVGAECPADEGYCRAAVWVATDGLTWERLPHDPVFEAEGWFGMSDVIAWDGGFLAAGDTVWTSPDGMAWTQVPEPFRSSASVWSIARFGGGIVAVGTEVTDGAVEGAAWWTLDGETWNRIPDNDDLFPTTQNLGVSMVAEVLSTPEGLIAVGTIGTQMDGGNPAVWRSTDGMSWQRIDLLSTGRSEELWGVGYDKGLLVAVGGQYNLRGEQGNAQVFVSADEGLSWTRIADDPVFGNYYSGGASMGLDVIGFGGKFIAVGSDGESAAVWIGIVEE